MNFLIKFIILVFFLLCSYLFFLPQQVQVLVQKWRKDHFSGGYRLILSWYQYIGLIGMIACLILFHCDFWWTGGLFPAFRLARSVRKFFKKKIIRICSCFYCLLQGFVCQVKLLFGYDKKMVITIQIQMARRCSFLLLLYLRWLSYIIPRMLCFIGLLFCSLILQLQ